MSAKILQFPISAITRARLALNTERAVQEAEPPARRQKAEPTEPEESIFDGLDACDPEYETVDSLAEYIADNDGTTFDYRHLQALAWRTGKGHADLRAALEAYGLKLGPRRVERETRGFSANSHDRWHGKGSSPTHGGGGGGSIVGMAWRTENG